MNKADLLKKFLNNSCNEEESRIVMQYLEAEPRLLDEMLSKSEWDDIDTSLPIIPGVETEIRKNIVLKTTRPIFRIIKPTLAAAAILSGLVFGLVLLNNSDRNTKDEDQFARVNQTLDATEKIGNNTADIKALTLADNTTIHLFPGSSIEYNIDFNKKRTIKLNGKAIFNVTKNTESPFVVYSGAISTTALGTRFLVDNYDDVNKINVKLFEGRVVVQPVDKTLFIEETFLEAGQQCFVDINTRLVKVKPLFAPKHIVQKKRSQNDKVNPTPIKSVERLNFSKTPMPEVLENLQAVYKQTIQFNREDISENYFTGSFSAKDSLSTILRVISVMNKLKINQEGETIKVTKVDTEGDLKSSTIITDNIKETIKIIGIIEKMQLDKISPKSEPIAEKHLIQHVQEKIVVDEQETRYIGISLPELLQKLQKQTKRKIYFNEEELENINFSGSIQFDDSIRNILSMICSSNGLTLTIKKGSYYINKAEK